MAKGTERENSLQRGGGGPARLWLMVVGGGRRSRMRSPPPQAQRSWGALPGQELPRSSCSSYLNGGGGKMGVNGGREMGGGAAPRPPHPTHQCVPPSAKSTCARSRCSCGGARSSVCISGGVPAPLSPPTGPPHTFPSTSFPPMKDTWALTCASSAHRGASSGATSHSNLGGGHTRSSRAHNA